MSNVSNMQTRLRESFFGTTYPEYYDLGTTFWVPTPLLTPKTRKWQPKFSLILWAWKQKNTDWDIPRFLLQQIEIKQTLGAFTNFLVFRSIFITNNTLDMAYSMYKASRMLFPLCLLTDQMTRRNKIEPWPKSFSINWDSIRKSTGWDTQRFFEFFLIF